LTPRNAQWLDPVSPLLLLVVAFHDGRRTRWEAGGREVRKARRTAASPEAWDAAGVTEAASVTRSENAAAHDMGAS